MAKSPSPEMVLYLEILFSLLFFVAAGFVHLLLRRVVVGPRKVKRAPWRHLLEQLSFPVALLAVSLLTRWSAIRNAFPLRARYFEILDSAFVFFVIFLLIRLVDALIQILYARKNRPFPLPRVLHGFILVIVYLAVLFTILDQFLRIDIKPLLTGSAILTAVLGLALQGVLGNILAGMSLHYTKSFSRGDWVRIGETEGVVIDTNWRETRVMDGAKNTIIFPNSEVASRMITNFSLPDTLVEIALPVKVAFDARPSVVMDLLTAAAREVADVASDPAPKGLVTSYDEFGMSYVLKFHVTDYARKDDIKGEVARLVWYKFQRRGIEIPMAIENKVGRVLKAVKPGERTDEAAAAGEKNERDLAGSSFLRVREGVRAGEPVLSAGEMRDLASLARRENYTAKEVLFRQGEPGDRCYVVASGRVRGKIDSEEGGKSFATRFEVGPGGIIGEMSLFTGMPRTATVVVSEDAELLEIDVEAFAGLLARNPDLAEAIAEIVSRRNSENLETLRKVKELAAGEAEKSANKATVLDYLKRLIHLFKR
ncbi:MAG: cyclic nucleotide-binding domain-containing protein [Candidatus Aminicenantales bacterium]